MSGSNANADAHLTQLLASARPRSGPVTPVRDAAVLLVIDTSKGPPRVLMGRRHGSLAFMAGKVVFPGGRVELADHRLVLPVSLTPDTEHSLGRRLNRRAAPTLPRALALAAIRETAEEAGQLLAHSPALAPAPTRQSGTGAGTTRSPAWKPLLDCGHVPAIDRLHYFARAITPPGRPRRFDTRFFLANAHHLATDAKVQVQGELSQVGWVSFADARAGDLVPITRTILDEAESRLDELDRGRMVRPLPFYFSSRGVYQKEMINVRP